MKYSVAILGALLALTPHALAKSSGTAKSTSQVSDATCATHSVYTLGGISIAVTDFETISGGGQLTVNVDGVNYEIVSRASSTGTSVSLYDYRGSLVVGWRAGSRGGMVFDGQGLVASYGGAPDLSVIGANYGEVAAYLTDPGLIDLMLEDAQANTSRWIYPAILIAAFVASCVDVEFITVEEFDEDGNLCGTTETTSVGWDCDFPFSGETAGGGSTGGTSTVMSGR